MRVIATLSRRATLVIAAATVPLLAAAPAVADVPEGWSNPEEVGLARVLLVLAGIPLLIALAITLAVYLPAMVRGERLKPGAETPDQWFGGPRRDTAELEAASETTRGGASGSW